MNFTANAVPIPSILLSCPVSDRINKVNKIVACGNSSCDHDHDNDNDNDLFFVFLREFRGLWEMNSTANAVRIPSALLSCPDFDRINKVNKIAARGNSSCDCDCDNETPLPFTRRNGLLRTAQASVEYAGLG